MLFLFRRIICLAVCLALAAALASARQATEQPPPPQQAQTTGRLGVKVALVDKSLNVKPVPKFALVVEKAEGGSLAAAEAATTFDGAASFQLTPGVYVVRSARPVEFEGKAYEWSVKVKIEEGREASIELSNDNAKTTELAAVAEPAPTKKGARRRVTEEAEMFQRLRDGVVTVEGELGHGTGFIVDDRGLILTNQHVVSTSKEVRIQFDRKHKVRAVVLAEDAERDVAVLWANLSACASCRTLTIAEDKEDEPAVIEGEKVFAIGSPLSQEKILTSGIASKVEKRAVISDVNINPGNSGGPLFNSVGEVVGITTFAEQAQAGPGVSGIVRIEEAAELLSKAREAIKDKERPSAELMPTEPDDAFPVDAIKARLDVKKFETKHYKAEVGDYDVLMLTPVHKFYLSEKDRLEAAREREKRNKGEGAQGTVDKYRNLRNWAEYAGQLKPVVEILALPETKATGKSMFLGVLAAGATGMMLPPDFKFKADFYEMTLTCDGKPVTPIRRGKSEIVMPMPSYFKVKNRFTYAGFYTYPLDAFDPARCQLLTLDLFSEEAPTRPERKIISPQMRARVWDDFDEYRKKQQQPPTPDKSAEAATPKQ